MIYYFTDDDCKPLVNSLVISRLDYGNAFLYGVNSSILSKLQRIQNTAARLISRKRNMNISRLSSSLYIGYECSREYRRGSEQWASN